MRRLPFSLGYLLLLVALIISGQSWAASNILPTPVSPYSKLGAITPFLDGIPGVTNNAVLQRLSPGNYTWATPGSGGGSGTITGVTPGAGLTGGGTSGNVPLALTYPVDAQFTASVSITAADAAKLVAGCNASASTAALPTIGAPGIGPGFSFDLLNAKSYYLASVSQPCGGTMTLNSGSQVFGASNGAVTLTPGQGMSLTVAPDSSGWIATNCQSSACLLTGGGGYPAVTSSGTITVTGSGTANVTVDLANSYLPSAGGTLTGPLLLPATTTGPVLAYAGAPTTGIGYIGGYTVVYRSGSPIAWFGTNNLFGALSTAIKLNNGTTNPGIQFNFANPYPPVSTNSFSSSAAANPAGGYHCAHSRSDTPGVQGALANGQTLCTLLMAGSDGTNFQDAAGVRGFTDGSWSASSTPAGTGLLVHPSGTNDSTAVYGIKVDSKYNFINVSNGSLPTCTACGTSSTVATYSGQMGGDILLGTSPTSTLTLTFPLAFPQPPQCDLTDLARGLGYMSAHSTTVVSFQLPTGFAAGDELTYHCHVETAS